VGTMTDTSAALSIDEILKRQFGGTVLLIFAKVRAPALLLHIASGGVGSEVTPKNATTPRPCTLLFVIRVGDGDCHRLDACRRVLTILKVRLAPLMHVSGVDRLALAEDSFIRANIAGCSTCSLPA
jgi:hypothetical protein